MNMKMLRNGIVMLAMMLLVACGDSSMPSDKEIRLVSEDHFAAASANTVWLENFKVVNKKRITESRIEAYVIYIVRADLHAAEFAIRNAASFEQALRISGMVEKLTNQKIEEKVVFIKKADGWSVHSSEFVVPPVLVD